MVMPPMRTSSNFPFSKVRTSSGESKRFRTVSSLGIMASLVMDFVWRAMCAGKGTRAILLDAFGCGGFQALAGAAGRGQNGRVRAKGKAPPRCRRYERRGQQQRQRQLQRAGGTPALHEASAVQKHWSA